MECEGNGDLTIDDIRLLVELFPFLKERVIQRLKVHEVCLFAPSDQNSASAKPIKR